MGSLKHSYSCKQGSRSNMFVLGSPHFFLTPQLGPQKGHTLQNFRGNFSHHHGGRGDQLALVVLMANSSPTLKVVIVHAEVRLHRETENTVTGLEAHFIWFYESSQPLSSLCALFFPSHSNTFCSSSLCSSFLSHASSLLPSLKELKSAAWMAFSVEVQPPCQR